MGKPKHRRCGICNVVTSRYAGTERVGTFYLAVWISDPKAGEVSRVNGTIVRCLEHADA